MIQLQEASVTDVDCGRRSSSLSEKVHCAIRLQLRG